MCMVAFFGRQAVAISISNMDKIAPTATMMFSTAIRVNNANLSRLFESESAYTNKMVIPCIQRVRLTYTVVSG